MDRESLTRIIEEAFIQAKTLLSFLWLPISIPLIFCQESIQYLKDVTGLRKRSLEGKIVLVTGASSGIGEALSKLFYVAGCRLILASRRKDELERVKNELVRLRTTGTVYVPAVLELDLGQLKSLSAKCKTALEIYGHVDILINCAGITHRGSVLETQIEVDQRIMNVNYFGALAITRAIVNTMIERKSGNVVFISSLQGKISLPFRSAYAASKHALQALADSLRAEVASTGIQVTVANIGYVKTNLSLNALTGDGERYGVMDASTEKGYSADYVAERVFKAVIRGSKEIYICNLLHRLAVFLRTFCPRLFFFLMSWRARKLQ